MSLANLREAQTHGRGRNEANKAEPRGDPWAEERRGEGERDRVA